MVARQSAVRMFSTLVRSQAAGEASALMGGSRGLLASANVSAASQWFLLGPACLRRSAPALPVLARSRRRPPPGPHPRALRPPPRPPPAGRQQGLDLPLRARGVHGQPRLAAGAPAARPPQPPLGPQRGPRVPAPGQPGALGGPARRARRWAGVGACEVFAAGFGSAWVAAGTGARACRRARCAAPAADVPPRPRPHPPRSAS